MRMRICYLDCHEAGLCCYLVIHIENLLRQLQLFYFHLCPIYWLSLVFPYIKTGIWHRGVWWVMDMSKEPAISTMRKESRLPWRSRQPFLRNVGTCLPDYTP
jgi:hypothetical protein